MSANTNTNRDHILSIFRKWSSLSPKHPSVRVLCWDNFEVFRGFTSDDTKTLFHRALSFQISPKPLRSNDFLYYILHVFPTVFRCSFWAQGVRGRQWVSSFPCSRAGVQTKLSDYYSACYRGTSLDSSIWLNTLRHPGLSSSVLILRKICSQSTLLRA